MCSIVTVLIISGVIVLHLSNPLRRSETRIREDILKITPIGTSMDEVIEIIQNNEKWELFNISYERGYCGSLC
jgi:arginine deiminase